MTDEELKDAEKVLADANKAHEWTVENTDQVRLQKDIPLLRKHQLAISAALALLTATLTRVKELEAENAKLREEYSKHVPWDYGRCSCGKNWKEKGSTDPYGDWIRHVTDALKEVPNDRR